MEQLEDNNVHALVPPRTPRPFDHLPADRREHVSRVYRLSFNEDVDAFEPAEPPSRSTMEKLAEAYGVELSLPADTTVERVQPFAVAFRDARRGTVLTELRDIGHFRETTPLKGQAGTRNIGGKLRSEPTSKYSYARVIGTNGAAGLFEEFFRSESQIFSASMRKVDSGRSHRPKLKMPKRYKKSQEAEIRALMVEQMSAFRNFQCGEGGFARCLEELHRFAYNGFAMVEPSFARTEAGWVWHRAEPREASTAEDFIQVGDQLAAVRFRTIATTQGATGLELDAERLLKRREPVESTFVLPFVGPRAWDKRVLLVRYAGFGNNWAGVPATRPAAHWVAFKRLLAQIIAAGADKWGNPVALLKKDPSLIAALAEAGIAVDLGDMTKAHRAINGQRASDAAVHWLGNGIAVEILAPSGTPPQFEKWLEYCDRMIAFSFTSEGDLQGIANAASNYVQSDVSERKTVRNAAAYTERVAEAIQKQIIEPLFFDQIEGLLEAPRFELVPPALGSADEFVEVVTKAMGPNGSLPQWPEELQREFYHRLGVERESDLHIVDDLDTPEPEAEAMITQLPGEVPSDV